MQINLITQDVRGFATKSEKTAERVTRQHRRQYWTGTVISPDRTENRDFRKITTYKGHEVEQVPVSQVDVGDVIFQNGELVGAELVGAVPVPVVKINHNANGRVYLKNSHATRNSTISWFHPNQPHTIEMVWRIK